MTENADRLALIFALGIGCLTVQCLGETDAYFIGDETWGCRKKHLAVVNPVCREPSDDVISLRGDWQFLARRHDQNTRRNSHDKPFFVDVAPWGTAQKIRVPGCWEAQGIGKAGISEPWSFRLDCAQKPLRHVFFGEGWYRTTVNIPKAWNGKRIWLKISGVNAQGWFWVNRQQAAHVVNYCGTYKYDVTDCVTPGKEAEIVAEVDNWLRGRKGCFNDANRWGGICRDVEIEATPHTFIDDAWVRGDFDARCAEAHVTVGGTDCPQAGERRAKNDAPCRVRFTVGGKSVVCDAVTDGGETVLRLPLADFHAWSPEHPNLYTGTVELVENGTVTHMRRERFGIRKLEVRGSEFFLNDRPYFLRGFGDDSVYPITGVPPADREFHLRNLGRARAAGFNFVRLHTHCEVPEYFEAADEAGILVQPELPYINGDIPTEEVEFDPVKDMLELHRNFRRHPSFAVYSNGNEGSFGRRLDEYLYKLAKRLDPDRLKLGMDSQFVKCNPVGVSDYEGGPVAEWPRGSINPDRPFFCHEYLNRTVKLDARLEDGFCGAWAPPVTRSQRTQFLAGAGLDDGWGDLLQRAQHALQRHWHKSGVESARSDPYCDGFCLWTIVDVVVRQAGTFTAQGVFNPFWDTKDGGATPESLARFNSPSAVLFDVPGGESVFRSGDSVEVDFLFAHYGDDALGPETRLEWFLSADGKKLCSGGADVGAQKLGPARKVASALITFPDVPNAVKAVLTAKVGSTGMNDREFWIFPKREKPDGSFIAVSDALRPVFAKLFRDVRGASDAGSAEIVVAEADSPLLASMAARGQRTIALGDVNKSATGGCDFWALGREIDPAMQRTYKRPPRDISLGWWSMGAQVGTALKEHPTLALLPHEGFLSPLLFGTIGRGRKLPFAGADAKTLIIVGEGGDACYAYMAETEKRRQIATWGLDLVSGRPEATAILDGIIAYLRGNQTGATD